MSVRPGQLLRIGRAAAASAEQRGARFAALVLATLAAALVLLSAVAAPATYEGRVQRGHDRAPLLKEFLKQAGPATVRWKLRDDTVGDHPVTVVYVEPLTAHAPLPPGVSAWPGPGQAVFSPALLERAEDGVTTRYGKVVGTIGARGLAAAGEELAYVRPAKGFLTAQNSEAVVGFGTAAPWAVPFGEGEDVRPLGDFHALIAFMLGLPAAMLLVVAARTGAVARDKRTAVLRTLGASRRDLALMAVGEAALPVALGCLLASAFAGTFLIFDVTLPWIDYTLTAAHLRAHAPALSGAVAAAGVLTLGAAALLHPAPLASGTTRPTASRSARATKAAAALFVPCQLLLAWFPRLFAHTANTPLSTLALAVGVIGSLATLPAVLALGLSGLGRLLALAGRRSGAPGALLAGRWVQAGPGRIAKLAAGPVIVAGLIAFIQVYPSVPSGYAVHYRQAGAEAGTSMLRVDVPDPRRYPDFVTALPTRAEPVTVETAPQRVDPADLGRPGSLPAPPATLRGSCPALRALDLPCTPGHPVRVSAEHRRARILLGESTARGPVTALAERPRLTRATLFTGDFSPPLLMAVATDRAPLSTADLRRTAYQVLGPGARVRTVSEEVLSGAERTARHLRWATFLGSLGVLIVAAAYTMNALAEILRFARAISPVTVLTGNRTIYTSVASWAVLAPLALAVPVATGFAVWLTLPLTTPPRTGTLPAELTTATAATLLLLAVVTATWTARTAAAAARTWRPAGD